MNYLSHNFPLLILDFECTHSLTGAIEKTELEFMLRAHNMSEEAATEILDLFQGPEVRSALCCLVVLTVHYPTTLCSLLPVCVGTGAIDVFIVLFG